MNTILPTDPKERKAIPIGTGVFDYFPAAFIELAKVSKAGNDQHNPGQPMHHARGKSTDHFDTAIRHLMERGTRDVDGQRHTAKALWRIAAMLQEECEADGAPLARGARLPDESVSLAQALLTLEPTDVRPPTNLDSGLRWNPPEEMEYPPGPLLEVIFPQIPNMRGPGSISPIVNEPPKTLPNFDLGPPIVNEPPERHFSIRMEDADGIVGAQR